MPAHPTTPRGALALALAALVAAGCSDQELNLHADAEARPDVLVSPELLDFGQVGSASSAEDRFTVENTGTAGLELEDVLLQGSGAFTLTVPEGLGMIPPGESVEVLVTYAPATSADEAVAWVHTDDAETPELPVALLGSILVADLLIDPNPKDFGYIEAGDTTSGEVDLVNVGGEDLTLSTIAAIGEGFSVLSQPALPLTLAPGESAEVSLQFAPPIEGSYLGELWVAHDAPGGTDKGSLIGSTTVTTVTGRICDPSGDGWVAGALVWAGEDLDGDGELDWYTETWTDGEGYFELENVRAGTITVHVEKGSFSTEFEVTVTGGTYELPEDECLQADLMVAVVTGDYDSIQTLLAQLEIPYDAYGPSQYLSLLRDPEALAEYDIIFFNCGMPFSWLSYEDEVAGNMQDFVAGGGSVYASDWAHNLIEASWPWAIDFLGDDEVFNPETDLDYGHLYPYAGLATNSLEADVLDATMAAAIGSDTAELAYDLDVWVVPEAAGSGVTTLVQGDPQIYDEDTFTPDGRLEGAPLALSFAPGGTVIYTTFHNEAQLTEDMEAALKEIILSL